MTQENFDELLAMLNPALQKQDTQMRDALRLDIKLEITLRYLATGDSFRTLAYMFRVPERSISQFLPEMLDEIVHQLSVFIEVSIAIVQITKLYFAL